jgi:methyl-accepting chemotaxis protein
MIQFGYPKEIPPLNRSKDMNLFFLRDRFAKNSGAQSLFQQIESLLDSARLLFSQSESLKKIVAVEKSSVQKSSSAALEISSMVGSTADAASELSRLAAESNKAVSTSGKSLGDLSLLIAEVDNQSKKLQEAVRSGLEEIGTVTGTMSEIREKAKMINDVVFQTKLLSFNASVEAARAGDHGKGFAVVAEEMGNLARASGQAAQEIEVILNTGVDRTRAQIDSVSKSLELVAKSTVEAIEQVSSKSKAISSGFSKLEDYAKQAESKAHEISAATKEQKIGVDEISKALHELERTSGELDSMAIASNQSSANLAAKVEDISQRFFDLSNQLGFKLVKIEKPFDFRAAITAHIDWKMKLSKYLNKPDGSLDHSKVCLDNACMLGKWIYGAGAKYKAVHPETFESLRQSHAKFHQTAGKIIELINKNQTQEAENMLNANGPYLEISRNTVKLIEELQIEVEGKGEGKVA